MSVANDRQKVTGLCARCFKPATARCSRCQSVVYCSRVCQAKDWKLVHKMKCGREGDEAASRAAEDDGKELPAPSRWLFEPEDLLQLKEDRPTNLIIGLVNHGNSCFANAVLQCLTATTSLQNYIRKQLHTRDSCKLLRNNKFCMFCVLQHHVVTVARVQNTGAETLLPEIILRNLHHINRYKCSDTARYKMLGFLMSIRSYICGCTSPRFARESLHKETNIKCQKARTYMHTPLLCGHYSEFNFGNQEDSAGSPAPPTAAHVHIQT